MATWGRRAAAILLDLVILAIPTIVITTVATAHAPAPTGTYGNEHIPSQYWVALGLSLVVLLGYFSFFDGNKRGQTIGKMALGIAVRDVNTGAPVGAGRALGRRLFFCATYLLFVVGFIVNILWPLWDPRKQGIHDKVANTCVVDVR